MKQNQKKALGLVGAALMSTAMTAPALHAQTADELRSQVFALEQRIGALEKQGGVKVPSGTTLQFGGYVKLDFIYDFDQYAGFAFDGQSIDVGLPGSANDGGFFAQARQSRFNFRSTTQTDNGPVVAFIEFDFFNGEGNELISNSNNPRLRHAYGEWNGILAGQTWSLFMPVAFGADTVDFGGPVGVTFIRQSQLRYTFPETNGVKVAMSLESSEFTGRIETAPGVFTTQRSFTTNNANGVTAEIDDMPDFVAAADWTNGVQKARGGLVLRHLNAPQGSPGSDDAIGYGVNFALSSPLWAGGTIAGSATYGDGIGRYFVTGVGQDAVVDVNGNVKTIQAWGASAQIMQQLSDTMSAGIAYGYYKVEDTFTATDTDNIQSLHATLFYKPNSKVRFGAEFIWGERELVNNDSDSISRLQGSVQFNF